MQAMSFSHEASREPRPRHGPDNAVARWRAILRAIHRLVWIGAYTLGFGYVVRSVLF